MADDEKAAPPTAGPVNPPSVPPAHPAPAPPPEKSAEPPPEWFYKDSDDFRFQWYMERRKGYSSGARESYARYDQTIAGVSAGAIVLSLTFLKDIGHEPSSIKWLVGSWILLLIAGGTSLVSLRTSADCDLANLAALDRLRVGKDYNKLEESAKKLGKKTELMNAIAIRTLLGGIALMMFFAFWNVITFGGIECPPPERVVRERVVPAKPGEEEPAPVVPVEKAPEPPSVAAPPPDQKKAALAPAPGRKEPSTSKRKAFPANP